MQFSKWELWSVVLPVCTIASGAQCWSKASTMCDMPNVVNRPSLVAKPDPRVCILKIERRLCSTYYYNIVH